MSDVCDPRKTGCDCYPFPHRKNSHPERKCHWHKQFNFNLGHGMFAPPTTAWVSPPLSRWIPQNYITQVNASTYSKCVPIPVLKQDE